MQLEKIFKRPKLIIAVCLIITVVLGFFIKDLEIDNSTKMFLPQQDESFKRLEDTDDTFGSMSILGISVTSTRGSILTVENIDTIKNITDRILEISDVESIDSLTHIDYVCDNDGAISATKIIPDTYTGSAEDIALLKSRLSEWNDMYDRVVINDDYTASQMQVAFKGMSDEEAKERGITDSARKENLVSQIRGILEEETKGKHLKFRLYGDDIITQSAREFMLSDLVILIPVVIVVVLLSLFFSFKTLDGTLLPLITVLMATIQSCGLMSLFNIKFTIVSSVIPVALIAVGSAYGIHMLNHYYVAIEELEAKMTKGKPEEEATNIVAVLSGLDEAKKPIMLAGITTIIGFISLVSSPIEPLHSFSVFTAVGVAISLLISLIFIPAILIQKTKNSVEKERQFKEKIQKRIDDKMSSITGKTIDASANASANTLYNIYHFFCGTKPRLIVFIVFICLLSAFGLYKLNIETSLIGYFPKSCQMNRDVDYVDEQFAGTNALYFVITGQEKGSITNPELLKAVDDMNIYLEQKYPQIGKTVSFNDLLKRINQVWHVPVAKDESDYFAFDDTESLDDFGSDFESDFESDWGDYFAFDDSETFDEAADVTDTWIDPNDLYSEKLSASLTAKDILDLLSNAYTETVAMSEPTVENMVKILQKQLNYNGMAYYEVPYDAEKYPVSTREELKGVVDNYLTLLSGSTDRFLDDEMNPKSMKIQIMLRTHSTKITADIIKDAKDFVKENFPEGYTLEATGPAEIETRMTEMVVSSQINSLVLSLVCVFVIIAVAFRSPVAGLIGAVPLALTILLNYMIMGFAGINLDLVTSIIASIAVGVGIDYTIHFLSTYQDEMKLSDDTETVTRNTFTKSGNGIIANALAVGFGFLVLCLSKFIVLRYIGILVAIVMFTSSFLAMTVIPGMLNIIKPKFIKVKKKQEA